MVFVVITLQLSARKIAGEIIFEDRVISTTLTIPMLTIPHTPDFEQLQLRVRYVDKEGKRKTLKPKQAKEFSFFLQGQHIRMVSKTNLPGRVKRIGRKQLFLKLEIDGPLKLFTYFDDIRSQTANFSLNVNNQVNVYANPYYYYSLSDHLILEKEDGTLKYSKNFGFRKDILGYLNECPVVTSLIESKSLKRRHLYEIVELYNQNCG